MINPNLGKTERAMRLVLGIVLAVWVWNRPGFGLLETVASISSLFLVLNAFLCTLLCLGVARHQYLQG